MTEGERALARALPLLLSFPCEAGKRGRMLERNGGRPLLRDARTLHADIMVPEEEGDSWRCAAEEAPGVTEGERALASALAHAALSPADATSEAGDGCGNAGGDGLLIANFSLPQAGAGRLTMHLRTLYAQVRRLLLLYALK